MRQLIREGEGAAVKLKWENGWRGSFNGLPNPNPNLPLNRLKKEGENSHISVEEYLMTEVDSDHGTRSQCWSHQFCKVKDDRMISPETFW